MKIIKGESLIGYVKVFLILTLGSVIIGFVYNEMLKLFASDSENIAEITKGYVRFIFALWDRGFIIVILWPLIDYTIDYYRELVDK